MINKFCVDCNTLIPTKSKRCWDCDNKTRTYKLKNSPIFKKRVQTGSGYIFIHFLFHPYANNQGYVREHRLVMENHLGRYLNPEEVVHHENDIRDDNRLKNLKVFKNKSEHMIFHKIWEYPRGE